MIAFVCWLAELACSLLDGRQWGWRTLTVKQLVFAGSPHAHTGRLEGSRAF